MKSSPSTASIYMERVEDHYDVIDVAEDCSLRDFIEDIKDKEYERGCSYYELTAKEVDIDSGKEVMLMNKVSSDFYLKWHCMQLMANISHTHNTLEWSTVCRPSSSKKNWSTWN